ncbi:hypothetical protein lerEdw1_003206 [Lerista edwardsae]|nr:hypothetical protein lerEdw1_003206 [Lerista edwardsae]
MLLVESLECWLLIGSLLVAMAASIPPLFQWWVPLAPQDSCWGLSLPHSRRKKTRMPAMLLFFNYKLWFLGYVCSASLRRDAGETRFHWNSWEPWVCMCDLHKQARIRHFVVWEANISLDMKTNDFWQERACSLEDCGMCQPQECPSEVPLKRFSLFPQFQNLLAPPKPFTLKIPLLTQVDLPLYENLPVVDDLGED